MRRRVTGLAKLNWAAVCLVLIAPHGSAQFGPATAASGAIGATIRVTDTLGTRRICALRAVRQDWLILGCAGDRADSIASRLVRRLEVPERNAAAEARHTRVGTVIGLVSGATFGLLFEVPPVRERERRNVILFPQAGLLIGTALGAVVGGIAGNEIGRHLPAPGWSVRYPLTER